MNKDTNIGPKPPKAPKMGLEKVMRIVQEQRGAERARRTPQPMAQIERVKENNLYSVHVHGEDAEREFERIMRKYGISFEKTSAPVERGFIVVEDGIGAHPVHGEIEGASGRGVAGLFGPFFRFTVSVDSIEKLKGYEADKQN